MSFVSDVTDALFLAVYTVLPCLTGAFAAALFLTSRSIRPGTAWLLAVLIAGLLTLGASTVIQHAAGGGISVASLVMAHATLYFLPTVVLTSVALSLRGRVESRTVGIVIILALFLGISFVSRRASGYFLDFVNATGDTGDAVFHSPEHVREHEARVVALSPCVLVPIDAGEPTRATISGISFKLRIPKLAAATPIEAPDDRWYGRQWSRDESLLLNVDRNPEFAVITAPGPTSCRLDLAGRPMQLRRIAPGNPGWAANTYAAEIIGFLDDNTEFWGQVVAPTETRRESLIAALATLERVSK